MVDTTKLIRHAFVGGSSALLLIILTWLLVDGLHLEVILGSSIAVVLTGLYNYSMQYHWTFSTDAPHQSVLVRYLLMCVGILVINTLVMYLGVKTFEFHYLIVQFMANVTMTAWSFCLGSIWVFAGQG
ncbi:Uncharacterised protein [Halioglobus japonicus]|nr:Uncharacterised protein [Halioglobus japonicus]